MKWLQEVRHKATHRVRRMLRGVRCHLGQRLEAFKECRNFNRSGSDPRSYTPIANRHFECTVLTREGERRRERDLSVRTSSL